MILGVDFDTRAVHAVLLDDDTNTARYVPIPIRDKRGSFEAARNVREAMREALRLDVFRQAMSEPGDSTITPEAPFDSIYLCGIEDSMYRSAQTVRALARVQGAILASLPRDLCVLPIPAGEWKKLTVGRGDASKGDVERWALGELLPHIYTSDARNWPQDAFDAYSIARAARVLNEQGIAAA